VALFASIDELGDLLGEAFADTLLAQAAMALEMASAQIQGWTRQKVERVVDDVIVLRGTYDRELELPERPVIEVGNITLDGTLIEPSSFTVTGSTLIRSGGWGGSAAVVEVVYTHGYEPIPEDIRAVTLQLAARMLFNPLGIRQEGIGTYSVTYSGESVGDADGVLYGLSRYRRRTASPRVGSDFRFDRSYPVVDV
jgi:hypothetical protein